MDDYLSATVFNDAVSPCALVTCKTRNNDNRKKKKNITDGIKYELWSSKDVYTVYLWSCVDLLKHMNCMCAWTTVYVQITPVLMWSRWSVVAASAGVTHSWTCTLLLDTSWSPAQTRWLVRPPLIFCWCLRLTLHSTCPLYAPQQWATQTPAGPTLASVNILINSVQMIKSLDEP